MWKKAILLLRGNRSPAISGAGTSEGSSPPSACRGGLRQLEDRLGHRFRNPALLDRALTHASYVHECPGNREAVSDYESLEFLGDSILGFVVAEFLFRNFKELSEGELTKIRGHLVSTKQLQGLSEALELGQFLKLSRGEEKTGGRRKKALLADLFESVVAAIYLDGGLEPARDFVLRQYEGRFEQVARGELKFRDHKSTLQEHLHRMGIPAAEYQTLEEIGPDHHKEFLVSVSASGRELARGRGGSKKEAEQQAAERAIELLGDLSVETPIRDQGDDVV